jgi:hypothetical protein
MSFFATSLADEGHRRTFGGVSVRQCRSEAGSFARRATLPADIAQIRTESMNGSSSQREQAVASSRYILSCLRGIIGSRIEEGVTVFWVLSSPVRLRQQVNRDLAQNLPCSLAYVLPKRKIREMPDS